MKATLTPRWELTDEHAGSGDGQPVLIDRTTGEAFGPGDLVQPYPSRAPMPAGLAAQRLAEAAELFEQGRALVARFVGSVLPR